jgi:hypothetical protein
MADIQEYYNWYEREYANVIGLGNLVKKADSEQIVGLKKLVKSFNYKYSSIWRHEVLSTLKYYIIPKKTDYICTVFKIIRKGESSFKPRKDVEFQTIYAFLYTSYTKKNVTHEFISSCPTFTSADGEYRHRFITLRQYLDMYQEYQKEVFDPIEEHVANQIKKKVISFISEIICPQSVLDNSEIYNQLIQSIDKLRLSIIFYITSWYIDYIRYKTNVLENHLSKGYPEAMFSGNDEKFYETNTSLFSITKGSFDLLLNRMQRFRKEPEQKFLPVEIGQKIMPLTISQVENIEDILYPNWAELRIASMVGDLVINGISPSFPIFNDWFFIKGSTVNMYDNQVMHIKLHNSETASEIVKELEQARKNTYILDPVENKEIFLGYNMEGLSRAIEFPMDFAEEEIVVSTNTLCSLTEHVGRTMADQPALMNDKDYSNATGALFSSPTWFSKYTFEYLYGLYSLNIKLGVIHGDLHLNNITLFAKRLVVNYKDGNPHFPNPVIIYNVHGTLYIYPTTGRTSCIIDFSRSVINDISPVIDSRITHNKYIIINEQMKKIMHIYEHNFPEFYNTYKAELRNALENNYSIVFKLLTAIDSRKLSMGMITLVPKGPLSEMMEKIKKMSEQYLTVSMLAVFKGHITAIEQMDWPLLNIIKTVYSDYTIEKYKLLEESTLIDYFSIDNEIQYNTRDYEQFPPTVKFDYIREHKIPIDQMGLKNYHEIIESGKIQQDEKEIYDIQEKERESKGERRDSPINKKEILSNDEKAELKKEIQNSSDFYYDT